MGRRAGFTLIELILVVAVVAILAAILVPTVFSILDDSAITKGKADVKAIAAAVAKFRDDTGEYPTRYAAGALGTEVNLLYSGTVVPVAADFTPALGGGDPFNCATVTQCETFAFPFITNTSAANAYSTVATAKKRWKGPYLSENSPDEFDDPYIVYVRRLRTDVVTTERAWIVFAGQNKLYETTPGSTSAQGDDFVFLLR
ncbi:MAG: prepilin-type N-terminal cleavage/methylation domain-containing protein [Nitrospiraceae bacterium]